MTPRNLDDIRQFIRDCLAKRDSPNVPSYLRPSDYWKYFIGEFNYVFELSDAELGRIRYHGYHLTGDYYNAYTHQPPASFKPLRREYATLIAETGGYMAGEGVHGFGHEIGGRRVTVDTIRYMQVVADLHRAGILSRLGKIRILEIGGGYGGLARCIMEYNPEASYAICDLEETMFFQAVLLSNNFGFGALELCQDGVNPDHIFEAGKFYLIPQRCADTVPPSSIDIVINQQSLQEMTPEQVIHYFGVIGRSAKYFYSCNSQHNSSITAKMHVVTSLQSMLDSQYPRIKWQSRSASGGTTLRRLGKLLALLCGRHIRRVGDYDLRRVLYEVRTQS